MSKIRYPAILVVEGITDQAFIHSFLDADIVTTNGSDVPCETILFLKEAAKKRDIVVLTDPDAPGKRIRDVLDKEIPGLLHAFVRKEHSIKKHKVGVAESTKEEILLALQNVVPSSKNGRGDLTANDLFELGLMGGENARELRKKLEDAFHIGQTNAKTLLKRLNALGLSRLEVEEALHG